MEVAVIDWKNIDSRFVKDDLYEHINAPQWVDFFLPDAPVDDNLWFCRPDCNHPKTAEDFFKDLTPPSKRSSKVSEVMPLGERNRRDGALKKRGALHSVVSVSKGSSFDKVAEDGENQNPNFSTPPNRKYRSLKETIKSSAEKKLAKNSTPQEERTPKLRSTLSARNLFAGSELLSKVTEFCNELKKLATRAKDRECVDKTTVEKSPMKPRNHDSVGLVEKDTEREPLLEVTTEKCAVEKGTQQQKLRRKINHDDAENTPISVDVKNTKHKEEVAAAIRTCPPTPQCFSASRGSKKATPPQTLRTRLQERIVFKELGRRQCDKEEAKEELVPKGDSSGCVAGAAEREARALDMFWFLKPCAFSS